MRDIRAIGCDILALQKRDLSALRLHALSLQFRQYTISAR